jgi:trk system potassium uptake protein TrkH
MIRLPSLSNLAYVGSGLLLIIAVFLLPSLVLSLAEADGQGTLFAVQIAVMLVVSLILRRLNSAPQEITIRDGFLIVTLGWLFMSLLGALPGFLSGHIPNFTDAVFEYVSGFTTTGASILPDIEKLPRSLLLWRSTTHWLGGMGVIALAVAIFPFLGASAYQLFRAEVPGPPSDRLDPRISQTAKYLWGSTWV